MFVLDDTVNVVNSTPKKYSFVDMMEQKFDQDSFLYECIDF